MISHAERARRYDALQAMMREQGYSCLVLAGNAEAMQRGYIRYVSDWRLWGGTGFAVLPLDGEPVLVLGSGSQAYWAAEQGWIADVRAALDKTAEVAAIVSELGLAERSGRPGRAVGRAIGVVGLNSVMSYGDALALQAALPRAPLADATEAVDRVMAIKSAEEIAEAAATYRSIAGALGLLRENLKPGITERELMSSVIGRLAAEGCLDGIAHLSNRAPPYIRPAGERRIERDEIIKVSLEFAGPAGYWIELAGVYSFREPPARARRHWETTQRALGRAAEMIRPGAVAGDISRAIEQTFREDGWNITGRAIWDFHSIGLNVIRPPIGLPSSTDRFEENMIINIHPGLLVDDDRWGVYMQDNLLVTPTGGRSLASYTYEWHVLPD